jgi:hypothetical protein
LPAWPGWLDRKSVKLAEEQLITSVYPCVSGSVGAWHGRQLEDLELAAKGAGVYTEGEKWGESDKTKRMREKTVALGHLAS